MADFAPTEIPSETVSETLRLSTFPTPLEPAPRLAVAIGLDRDDLWIKRDDLTGLGAGGNKVRKLQHTAADALSSGATTLVTTGAAQSNHARLTAAVGARLGLEVVLVLAGSGGAVAGNLALDALLGATIRWAGDVAEDELEQVAADVVTELTAAGRVVARIPFGGTSVAGARGYVAAGLELIEQMPDLDLVVVAVGSGGTAADSCRPSVRIGCLACTPGPCPTRASACRNSSRVLAARERGCACGWIRSARATRR